MSMPTECTTFFPPKKSNSFSDKDDELSTSASGSERISSESDGNRTPKEVHRPPTKAQRKPKKRAPQDKFNGTFQQIRCAPFSSPPGLTLPPGLELKAELAQILMHCPPPGLPLPSDTHTVTPPPGLHPMSPMDWFTPVQVEPPSHEKVFSPKAFRKELTSIMREMAPPKSVNASVAVRRLRECGVPHAHQTTAFTDILTRTVEEVNGPTRRQSVAFVVGLATGLCSAFDADLCLAGVKAFFEEYDDLLEEVPKLPTIVKRELWPTLLTVWSADELNAVIPESVQLLIASETL